MWTVCLCKGIEYFEMPPQEIRDKFFLFEMEQKLDIGIPFKYNGKYYTGGCGMPADKVLIVHEFKLEGDGEDLYAEDNIKCPYCGDENHDSFEASDSDKEEKCHTCGSIFAYQREVKVTYDSFPVKKFEIKEIESVGERKEEGQTSNAKGKE